ncbi:MAG: hypothetical protein B9S32_17310 [Verrucomicrobia bacterium Tous-C9LFEB]|nr:MAG: hypothetical protein B9S32_17310 [Verrucomicrobia bacterium Tous-C9LFEB]
MDRFQTSRLVIGFPSGVLEGSLPFEALEKYRTAGFSTVEIHPQSPQDPLLDGARQGFREPSVHLPCQASFPERETLAVAHAARERGYTRIVAHPNVIRTFALWRELGESLLVENLDFRFPGFQWVEDLQPILEQLPDARFCLDVAHAWDGSVQQGVRLFETFRDRLAEVHFSEIDLKTAFHREDIGGVYLESCRPLLKRVPVGTPLILEMATLPLTRLQEVRKQVERALGEELHAPRSESGAPVEI